MAKPPSKTQEPATKVPPARPRAVKAPIGKPKAATTPPKPLVGATPAAATVKPKAPRRASAAPRAKPAPVNPPVVTAAPTKSDRMKATGKGKARTKTGGGEDKSLLEGASSKIHRLAADILADRIVPTYEQIKALAASALGQKPEKSGKSKGKKKKK
ncbi:hypothetical protein BH11PSE6_BH11PSE6_13140 [soil metagenome]